MKIILSALLGLVLLGCSDNSTANQEKDEINKQAHKSATVIVKSTTEVMKTAQKASIKTKPALDGAKLFVGCAGCHGSHGERKAMGTSQVIQGWESEKVSAALHGFKDGSYGGKLKGIMKGQVSKLSDDEIVAIGDYISKQ